MSDPMQEIRASFFIECEELLESLQDALQTMDDGDTSNDTINVAFRAVHSIKGGAGAFGLDQLVSFAHSFETCMDDVRSGSLTPDPAVIQLFFQCGDMLSDLVRVSRDGEELSNDQISPLIDRLKEISSAGDEAEEEEDLDFQPMGISLDLDFGGDDAAEGAGESDRNTFEIVFAPEPELYSSGNEPLFMIRALVALGDAEVTREITDPPDLESYSRSAACLAWHIHLQTDVDEDAIREVFEFVDGLCRLEIAAKDKGPSDEPPDGNGEPEPPEEAPKDESPADDAKVVPPKAEEVASPPAAPAAAAPAPAAAPAKAKPAASQPSPTVRVDLDRVDRLINLVGELVINQAMLTQSIEEMGVGGNSNITSGLDELQQLTRDIQDSVMMIRAQPVKSLFQRMARIVREASAAVGKTVRLTTEGEATEIDKTVIERLADPLTHMIRNAVDHGLENKDARVAAGKTPEGNITLTATHRSGRVMIEIADDGGGINRPRVKSIAEEKGLIPPGQDLSDGEIDMLLFLPGFSTAKEISNLSGRGVGMDVVKSAITSLGGRISITSESGVGTTFSISLPLTLAVLDGMVIKVSDETLVLPLSSVSETLSIGEEDVRGLGPETQVISVRDVFVPIIDLGSELGYSAPRQDYLGAIVLLVAQEDGTRAALVVDSIEDQRQVVIKGLEHGYGRVPGVAAATILGDGQIALILDPTDLLANASGRSRQATDFGFAQTG